MSKTELIAELRKAVYENDPWKFVFYGNRLNTLLKWNGHDINGMKDVLKFAESLGEYYE